MRARSLLPPVLAPRIACRDARPLVALLSCVLLGACAALPALPPHDDAAAQSAPYPALIPLGPVLAQAAGTGAPAPTADVEARLSALAARAAALRGPVVGDATSARLTNALR